MTEPAPRVWIVTSGSYSDYGIRIVFATKELADAYIAREALTNRYDDFNAEEWELLTAVPPKVAVHRAYARLEPDGTLGIMRVDIEVEDETKEIVDRLDAERPDERSYTFPGGAMQLSVNYCRTADEAQKALYDLAARVKAERRGHRMTEPSSSPLPVPCVLYGDTTCVGHSACRARAEAAAVEEPAE